MAIRDIVLYVEQQAVLRKKSKAVPFLNQKVLHLIRDLKETLAAHGDGIGLAAPQINVHKQVVIVCPGTVVDGSWQAGPPIAMINPEIVEANGARKDFDGCLSFPGIFGETTRPHYLRITGLDEAGNPFDQVYEGFDAVMIHHEIDHLQGVLFIDRIENPQDLYKLSENEQGQLVRVPVTIG